MLNRRRGRGRQTAEEAEMLTEPQLYRRGDSDKRTLLAEGNDRRLNLHFLTALLQLQHQQREYSRHVRQGRNRNDCACSGRERTQPERQQCIIVFACVQEDVIVAATVETSSSAAGESMLLLRQQRIHGSVALLLRRRASRVSHQ